LYTTLVIIFTLHVFINQTTLLYFFRVLSNNNCSVACSGRKLKPGLVGLLGLALVVVWM